MKKFFKYFVFTAIIIGMFFIIGLVDAMNFNSGYCKNCNQKYEYVNSAGMNIETKDFYKCPQCNDIVSVHNWVN